MCRQNRALEERGGLLVGHEVLEKDKRPGQHLEELEIVGARASGAGRSDVLEAHDKGGVGAEDLGELAVVIVDEALACLGDDLLQPTALGGGGVHYLLPADDRLTVPAPAHDDGKRSQ
jgi:hypothetical protein